MDSPRESYTVEEKSGAAQIPRLLIVDDDESVREAIKSLLLSKNTFLLNPRVKCTLGAAARRQQSWLPSEQAAQSQVIRRVKKW